MPEGQETCVTSRVLGTFGYFDPEYTLVSRLHIKSRFEVSIEMDIILLFRIHFLRYNKPKEVSKGKEKLETRQEAIN